MPISAAQISQIVRSQLAIDLNCSPDAFDSDGFVFCEARENPGRRPFPRGECHFEMLTMGGAVIVSATPDILPFLREQLDGKTRDDAFSMPFVYGSGLFFLPDDPQPMPDPAGVTIEMLERDRIMGLYVLCKQTDFTKALQFDPNHSRPDILATVATVNGQIAGIAGACIDCDMMWQIGIDVLPSFRKRDIAAVLTNRLTIAILNRGKVPYYGTGTSNIASQRVAHRAGFRVAWSCAYRGHFGDILTSPTV